MSWFNRFSNLFRRNEMDEQLEEELQFHLAERARDNLNAGHERGSGAPKRSKAIRECDAREGKSA